jgi:hypothetical protein
MSIEEAVIEKLRALPADKQLEVLDFAEFLRQKRAPKQPRKGVEGLWADLGVTISAEDIEEVRREMWQNFPREFEL